MRLVYDLVDNLRAVVLAARLVQDPTNRLAALFPYQTTDDLRFRLLQRQRIDTAGSVRAFDTPSRQIRRAGVVEVKGGLPAVSAITTFTETDLQRARMLAGISADQAALQNDVEAAAADVTRAVDNTYELLRGSVLTTGRLAIDNGEVIQSADYGVPTENLVAPAIPWTNIADAKVLDDLDAWGTSYLRAGLGRAGRVTSTQMVLNLVRRNAQVRAALATNANTNAVVTLDALNAYLASEGLPTFGLDDVNERVIDGQRVVTEGKMVWTPSAAVGAIGQTMLGISEQGVQLAANGVLQPSEVPGITIATLVEDHPISRHVNADSVGLPVLNRPEGLFIATVFPAPAPAVV